MNILKKTLFIVIVLGLFACSKKEQMEHNGGSFRMCLEIEPMTYVTHEISDYYSATVASQIMEGLVSLDPATLKITGQLASSWTVNDDGTLYEFNLRNDVLFHEHELFNSEKDRLLSPEDVVATFKDICKPQTGKQESPTYQTLLKGTLVGVEAFNEGKTDSIAGIKTSANKVSFHLQQRDDNFLYKLSQVQLSIIAKELIDAGKQGDKIGTGPFVYNTYLASETPSIILTKNDDYYEKDENGYQLPYLDTVQFLIQNRKLEQLDLFESKKIDMILALPTNKITRIVEGRLSEFNSTPPKLFLNKNGLLQTHYIGFNMNDKRFEDPRVRQAFNFAIDRNKIGIEVLKNQYDELGIYGFVPPIQSTFRGYDFDEVKRFGFNYDPERARKLLKEAGYKNGKDFGKLNLRYNIGDINSAIADEFASQIFQVLGINVNIDGSDFEQLNKDAIQGNADLFKSSWIADYPNPENFLDHFYHPLESWDSINTSGNYFNSYKNANFDAFLEDAKKENNLGKKMKLYSKAEIELLKNPPFIPLWYSGDLQIVYSYVRNLHFNAISMFNFKKVYLKEWTAEEYQLEISKKK